MIDTLSVEEAISLALEHHEYDDAVFAAETFCAQVECDDAWYLLAVAYFRMGRLRAAYALLQQRAPKSGKALFLAAQCAYKLELFAEAEMLLTDPDCRACLNTPKMDTASRVDMAFGKSAAFAHLLLANIYNRTFRAEQAVSSARRALQQNPLLWSAVEIICRNAPNEDSIKLAQLWHQRNTRSPRAAKVKENSPPLPTLLHETPNSCSTVTKVKVEEPLSTLTPCTENTTHHHPSSTITPVMTSTLQKSISTSNAQPSAPAAPRKTSANSRLSRAVSLTSADQQQQQAVPSAPVRQSRRQSHNVFSQNRQQQLHPPGAQPPSGHQPSGGGAATRKSQRIIHTSIKENAKSSSTSSDRGDQQKPGRTGGRRSRMHQLNMNEDNQIHNDDKDKEPRDMPMLIEQVADNVEKEKDASNPTAHTKSTLWDPTKSSTPLVVSTTDRRHASADKCCRTNCAHIITFDQKTPLADLYPLIAVLHDLHVSLRSYDSSRMLGVAERLSDELRSALPVQLLLARAHFENGDYQKAVSIYREIRSEHPYNVVGYEFYSTALWHLQKEHELSALAQELTKRDPTTPQAWCVAGNCFSLQKEHEIAVKFFERAIQSDPSFGYAYTLLGHEYMAVDDTGKAQQAFRNALQLNPRHYNAWFGLSLLYYRQQQMPLAYRHLCRAMECNRFNTVIQCHLAVVLSAMNQSQLALKLLDDAIKRAPNNVMCKYHRSQLLYAKGDFREALDQLSECKQLAPKEPMVYFLTGTVHKRLGNSHLALMNLSWATELDPRGEHSSALGVGARYVGEQSSSAGALEPDEGRDAPDTDISIVDD